MNIWHGNKEKPETMVYIMGLSGHVGFYDGEYVHFNYDKKGDFIDRLTLVDFCNHWCYVRDFDNYKRPSPYNNLLIAIECLKSILSKAPACYNTCECPLKGGDGFDQGCSYCAYLKAHVALKNRREK